MPRTFAVSNWARDGLHTMTDKEYAATQDTSPPIGVAYAKLGQVRSNMLYACGVCATYGIKSRISGVPRGEAPADGGSRRVKIDS